MSLLLKLVTAFFLVMYHWLVSVVLAFVPKRFRYKSIAGEIALVTGGGSGIGRALALRFASKGAKVVVWDLNLDSAKETVELIKGKGGKAEAYQCDVSKPQNVYDLAKRVKKEVGKVDILVNNAGIVSGRKFLDIPDNLIVKTFEVNAISHFWTCKAFLPDMIQENHGHIVSIASMAGLCGVVKLTDYCASKFAAVGFEESLRLELHCEGHTGIHSTVVCPYFISTGMFHGAKPGLFTMMTPEYVADQIMSAVLVNQEILHLPKIFGLLLILKSIFPAKLLQLLLNNCNVSSSMHGFRGRKKMKVDRNMNECLKNAKSHKIQHESKNGTEL